MRGLKIYLGSYYITCGLLIPVYACVLYRVYKLSKFKFVIHTAWLLLLSNIMSIVFAYTNQVLDENPGERKKFFADVTQSITVCFKDMFFNIAHWKFAFQYYSGSRVMLYCLADQPVPDAMIKRNSRLNLTFIFLNALLPFLEGIAYFFANTTALNKPNSYKPILTSAICIKAGVIAL